MAKQGIKHLVKCVCVLPQLSKQADLPSHEFKVFSVHDDTDDDSFEPSFVQCTNCGVVHKVIDICTSTIMRGRDEMSSVVTIDDVKQSIPQNFAAILEQNKADLPTWQHVAWVLEEKKWGTTVVLTSEYIENTRQGKLLTIIGETLFKVGNFTSEMVAG
jgi:hypothetical protein